MKTLPVLLLFTLLACNNKMNKENLSGVYVCSFRSEYAVGTDTLQFSKTADDTYRIRKVSAYHRIKNSVLSNGIERHEEHWLGEFDKEHNVVHVLPSGKIIGVDEKQNQILSGRNIYKRIDE